MSTTEKTKTAKAPAKPRKAAAKTPAEKTTVAKTAAAKTTTAKAKVAATPPPAPAVPTHQEIAILAEKYWAERGWQDGAAEQDWLRAERELMKIAS